MSHPHLAYERIVEQTIFSRVRELLLEKFDVAVSDVGLDSRLVGDLRIEPADLQYLALTLEAAFDVSISTADAARIATVRDAVRCILVSRAQAADVRPNAE